MAHIQVVTTAGSREEAERIARLLVERRLAGCVQVLGPVRSLYWWEGRVEEAEEWLCIAKSREDLFPELEAAIREGHSYQVPEILATRVDQGSRPYLEWLDRELKPLNPL
jgi:periplasmic divalent cation tolerance protein